MQAPEYDTHVKIASGAWAINRSGNLKAPETVLLFRATIKAGQAERRDAVSFRICPCVDGCAAGSSP
jgi:hypothetical protein